MEEEIEEIDEVYLNKRGKRVLSNKIAKLIIKKYGSSWSMFDIIWGQTFYSKTKKFGNHLLSTIILIIKEAMKENSEKFSDFAPFQ
jgi:hypothetical protein